MPQAQKTMPFGPWAPDLTSIDNNTADVISGVVPRADGYGPFKDFAALSSALPSACRGHIFARKSDGSIAVFAGTATDLYLLNNSTFTWTVVSKGGVSYSSLVSTDNWQFVQFNDLVVAVQVNTPPQKFVLSSATNFVDLGGTPPQAGFVSIIGFFLVLSGLLANPKRLQWSDLSAPETWTAGVGLADYQDMSDGGNVIACSGGDAFGVCFQQESIRTITYAPGSVVVFQINRISTQETLFGNFSIINVGIRTFYVGASGFKMIEGSNSPTPIGKEIFDRTFFADVDLNSLQLLIGASDPTATRVYWAYKSGSGQAGLFDKLICYDYVLKQATLVPMSGEWLGTLARPGLTLEQLDAIAPGALKVMGAANNGAGLIRLTLNQISNSYFQIAGQNFIEVQGVVGTTEANGTWKVNIISPTQIDLIGSTFVNPYVSGGAIGGSLDALPFSLDSISRAATAQLAGFNAAHQLGFYTGPNIEAILETSDGDPLANTIEINGLRPMTDCANALVCVGGRFSPSASVAYSTEVAVDNQGWAEAYVETRYARGRMRAPYGSTWTYAQGVQPDVAIAGDA